MTLSGSPNAALKRDKKRKSYRKVLVQTQVLARCAQILTIILQQLRIRMDSNEANQLPLLFPERNNSLLFSNPWPNRDLPHSTPKRDSDQWKAVMRFRNSRDWNKRADLQKFADYFGVDQSGLSKKIKESQKQWIQAAAEGAGSSQGDPPSCSSPPPSTLPP
jgi:hypothetical protein